jgi:hypothetical protein
VQLLPGLCDDCHKHPEGPGAWMGGHEDTDGDTFRCVCEHESFTTLVHRLDDEGGEPKNQRFALYAMGVKIIWGPLPKGARLPPFFSPHHTLGSGPSSSARQL